MWAASYRIPPTRGRICVGVSVCPFRVPSPCVGILPPHHDSHAKVMAYRKDQYSDILHALTVVRFVNDATPQVEVYLRMYQLESGKLPRSPSFPLVSGHSHVTFNATPFLRITFSFVCQCVCRAVDSFILHEC